MKFTVFFFSEFTEQKS